jgi:hypothetical protein
MITRSTSAYHQFRPFRLRPEAAIPLTPNCGHSALMLHLRDGPFETR